MRKAVDKLMKAISLLLGILLIVAVALPNIMGMMRKRIKKH